MGGATLESTVRFSNNGRKQDQILEAGERRKGRRCYGTRESQYKGNSAVHWRPPGTMEPQRVIEEKATGLELSAFVP